MKSTKGAPDQSYVRGPCSLGPGHRPSICESGTRLPAVLRGFTSVFACCQYTEVNFENLAPQGRGCLTPRDLRNIAEKGFLGN